MIINCKTIGATILLASSIVTHAQDLPASEDYTVELPNYQPYKNYLTQVNDFGYAFLRFNPRGYTARYEEFRWNGLLVNDLRNEAPLWGAMTGLASNTRYQEQYHGSDYNPLGTGIGSLGGVTHFSSKVNSNNPFMRGAYSFSNRTYTHRAALAYQSGTLKRNWNTSAEVSWRGGRSLSVDGVYADVWSVYASAAKTFAKKRHTIELAVLYAPAERGTQSPSTDEAFTLTQNNFYNPNWGYQNDRRRTARTRLTHIPIVTLAHTWRINDQTRLYSTIGSISGKSTYTSLNWQNAPNPYPDYYRNMPSFQINEQEKQRLTHLWQTDPTVQQINFPALYSYNQNNTPQANYIIENQIRESYNISAQTSFNHIAKATKYSAGGEFYYTTENRYKTVNDLLGASYWLDIDYFTEFDDDYRELTQNNLQSPDRHVAVGEKFGYNYRLHTLRIGAWAAIEHHFGRWFIRGAASFYINTLAREGLWEKQNFPSTQSLGKSETLLSTDYTLKANVEYRIGQKTRAGLTLFVAQKPPTTANSLISPDYRNTFCENLQNETILSADLFYNYLSENLRIYASLYHTTFKNQTQLSHLYDDQLRKYTDYLIQNIATSYSGIEFSGEFRLISDLWLRTTATISNNRYRNNPTASIYYQTTGERLSTETIHYKNLAIPSAPQIISALSVGYEPRSWTIRMTLNGFGRSAITPSPTHYTTFAMQNATDLHSMTNQEMLIHAGCTLDLFGGKTFYFNNSRLNIYAGINNLLNNTQLKSGGFQSNRLLRDGYKYSSHASKYYYTLGINGFITLSYSF